MKKLVNFRLSVIIALSLCVGIFSVYLSFCKHYFLLALTISLFILALLLYVLLPLKNNKEGLRPRLIFALVFIVCFVIGFSNVFIRTQNYVNASLSDNFFDINGRITKVSSNDYGNSYLISEVEVDGTIKGKIKYNILLYVEGERSFDIGDKVAFSTTLFDKDIFYENRFSASDIQKRIKYYAYVNDSDINVIGYKTTLFEKVNLFIRDVLKENLSEKGFPIAYAMLTGDSSFIEEDTMQSFRNAGVAHIFAVSGLHIGVLAVALTFVLKKLNCNKIIRVIITSLTLLFYSGICGFSASSLRAFIMFSVMLSCECFGERYDPLSAIGISASIILLIDGINLFCVGFQLSFAVVVGIVTLSSTITRWLKFLPNKIASTLATALSSQIFSVPISLYAFGQCSTISVFMNVLFLPVASFIFIFLLICTLLAGITTLGFLLIPVNYLLEFMAFIVGILDYNIFLFGGFTFGIFTLVFFFLALLLAGVFNLRGRKFITIAILCLVVMVSGTFTVNIVDKSKPEVRVIGSPYISATQIFDGKENLLVISDFSASCSVNRLKRLSEREGVYSIDKLIILKTNVEFNVHLLITKLLTIFELKSVVYYGEENLTLETAVNGSLPGIQIDNALDNYVISSAKSVYTFRRNGLMLSCNIGGKKLAIFGNIGSNSFMAFDMPKFDYAIAYDYLETLKSLTNANTFISYKTSQNYVDAERRGNLIFKIK